MKLILSFHNDKWFAYNYDTKKDEYYSAIFSDKLELDTYKTEQTTQQLCKELGLITIEEHKRLLGIECHRVRENCM